MKQKLLNLWLLAVMMIVGSSGAWADDAESVSFNFEGSDASTAFTGRSRVTVAIEKDETLNSNVVAFTCAGNAQNGYCFADYNFKEIANTAGKVVISFDYYNTTGGRSIMSIGDADVRGTTGNSSKTTYSKRGALFRIGSDKNNFLSMM